jgi:hypothetical protein
VVGFGSTDIGADGSSRKHWTESRRVEFDSYPEGLPT